MSVRFCLALSVALCAVPLSAAEPLDDATFFRAEVRPILADKCFKCHGPDAEEGELRLDVETIALEHGAILPGKPEESELLRRVLSEDESERMPPAEVSEQLTKAQTDVLHEWIRRGAPFFAHWAYERDRNVVPPATADSQRQQNPIDAFIQQRLERNGLALSPEADRETLIRRASLDLIGLLPSPEEIAAFVTDESPDAYERLVDRLIASPHYGERQARHWLDLARYADSNGYTIDGARKIWPYRDWVIESINANMPFDKFTVAQLAGDLLPKATNDQIVATGFQRNTPFNEEGGTDPEQFRVERTIDRTNTIGSVWLGLTVSCAQCHDHKYDAISQREYYQLYAFFNSADESTLSLPTPEERAQLSALTKKLNALKKQAVGPPADSPEVRDLLTAIKSLDGSQSRGWKNIIPSSVSAEQGTSLSTLDDASILAVGNNPANDVYHVSAKLPAGRLTAVQLEALTHDSLPRRGPGRADNGNFVLSRFELKVGRQTAAFSKAVADHSQEGYHVGASLDEEPTTGWAISTKGGNQNVDRTGVFVTDQPIELTEETPVEFILSFVSKPNAGYNLGRFRLAVSDVDPRIAGLPVELQQRILAGAEIPADELRKALTTADQAAIAATEAELKRLRAAVTATLVFKPRSEPRTTNILIRGNFLDPGDQVLPGTFDALPPLEAEGDLATRLDLARWLVRDDHPLTPRVVVNRMWQYVFGTGLVETENDFGVQGSLPTHPELLDWLAEELVRSGWDLKHIQRLIVTSATYRQSSDWRDDSFAKDPRNKLLARQNRLRLEAEILRDAALSASGLFCDTIGGPGVFPPQPDAVFSTTQSQRQWVANSDGDRYRRGMYTYLWRQSQHPLMSTFDGPDAQVACTRRNRSNTPLQALHLANDEVFVELAGGLAKRVEAAPLTDDAARIEYAFELSLGRKPSSDEREALLGFLHDQQGKHPDSAWLLVARTLLNLDEFVTRE